MGYYFVATNDGSPGLFDEDVNDIYHSSFGAYQEAHEKFVIPAQLERFKNTTCKVLDICYGIGYNTKALLNYSIQNNLNINFEIDAVELNKDLVEISPFIKSSKNYKYENLIDQFLLKSILENQKIDLDKIKSLINKNKKFLTLNKPDFDKILQNLGYKYEVKEKINAFLHNIYYHNITNRNKKDEKSYIFSKNSLKWHIDDARKVVLSLSQKYDIIFLDAFSACKQPILWTKQFISLLSERLDEENGILVSYATSSPFRKALLEADLLIGKFYEENINTTLASYNENLLKYKLNSFELELLNTRAGICYQDEKLNANSEDILLRREAELKNSKLESTSSYYKKHNIRYNKKNG